MRAIAIDLGGTFLRCGLVEESGNLTAVSRRRIRNFLDGESSNAIWEAILSSVVAYAKENQHLIAHTNPIVFSFPGPIEKHTTIIGAPTIVGKDSAIPDIAGLLSRRTSRPVFILNDISAAAWYLSQRHSYARFMTVTVSSGIGSKIFDRRHPEGVLDGLSYCGELGHMVVDCRADAPLCDCGGRGHLGAIASGRGVQRLAHRVALGDSAAFRRSACVQTYGADLKNLSNEHHLVPAARSGDDWALNVIRTSIEPLAEVLLAVILAVGLEKVIVIGGFAQSLGLTYSHLLQEALAARSTPAPYHLPVGDLVELADTDEETCLHGAAAFAALALDART